MSTVSHTVAVSVLHTAVCWVIDAIVDGAWTPDEEDRAPRMTRPVSDARTGSDGGFGGGVGRMIRSLLPAAQHGAASASWHPGERLSSDSLPTPCGGFAPSSGTRT
jgi:hypothetical protein